MAKFPSNGSGPFSFLPLPETPFPFASLPQIPVNGGLPMSTLIEFARSQARAASKCSGEIARFAEQRLDRDEELLTEMASCRDWGRLAELQGTWAADAVRDYMQETGQIMELLQQAYSEAAAAAAKKTERAARKTGKAAKPTPAAAA
jgi:hypothetical protein